MMTEPISGQCTQGFSTETEMQNTSAEIPVGAGPWGDPSVPWVRPHPYQQVISPEILDPLSFRFECPYQPMPSQLTYQDYHMEASLSQHQLPADPGPSYSSNLSSSSTIWLNKEPVFSNSGVDLHKHEPMENLQFKEEPTEVPSHINQTLMYDIAGDGQVVLYSTHESGPTYISLEPAETHQNSEMAPVASVFETSKAHSDQHQTAGLLYECRVQTTNIQPQPSLQRHVGALWELRSKKPCHCTRSRCLKLYCECFANGGMCRNCDCSNCHNNEEHEMERHEAIKLHLGRNPKAFKSPNIAGWKSGKAKSWYNKGCNCKRSGCLKNYCECYEANIHCSSSCKCVGCLNHTDNSQENVGKVRHICSASVLTRELVETVCTCLLAQAEDAERDAQMLTMGQHLILIKFGDCLSEIVKAMFSYSPH